MNDDLSGDGSRDLEQLSAYLDGELSPEERREIECRLRKDAALAESLEELRATSAVLQRWTVDEPEIPRWLYRIAPRPGRRRWTERALAVASAACFVAGLAIGRAATPASPPPSPAPATASSSAIPREQAGAIFREVTASVLRSRLEEAVRERRWHEAEPLYRELTESYSDTRMGKELLRDPRRGQRLTLPGAAGRI